MTPAIDQLWVYLTSEPLLNLLLTFVAYMIGVTLHRFFRGFALFHPVIVATTLIVLTLLGTGTSYTRYFDGAQFIHFLLGPATVALAIPLYDHLGKVRQMLFPIMSACVIGILVAAVTTLGIAYAMGASHELLMTLAPRSVTTPIAMGVADELGGIPPLAVGFVLLTGAIGATTGPLLFKLLRIDDPAVQGFTMGLSAHGFGTAQSFSTLGPVAGAFAGLSMGLTGLVTAFLLPVLVMWLGG
ncbi:LrgB family protein [Larsenimonas suaedae]|uniref:LrgB family protein n=1 Tax=Larsenimonas suaedae TaxID=1851019 RepID=A0ABU1GVB2_9GAMM|nr:LrgB family protein [Larsenimonas suaedae]MCM2971261.1 LrgB family protein [Larsenimonas suaedae]MDR5895970.1 LrgB family protein [Larsenimonas suaedae]